MKLRTAILLATIAVGVSLTAAIISVPSIARGKAIASALANDARRFVKGDDRALTMADAPIHCWGDSLTSGYGGSAWHDYPHLLHTVYQRKTVNLGIPKETSVDIKERFLKRPRLPGPETVVIWAGRNDSYLPDQVIASVAEMVNSLNPGSKYLVLGVTSSDTPNEFAGQPDHDSIEKINRAFSTSYGSRYLPIKDLLIARANRRFDEDVRNVANGTIPRSLRSDRLHLNDAGAVEVAVAVNRAFVENGW